MGLNSSTAHSAPRTTTPRTTPRRESHRPARKRVGHPQPHEKRYKTRRLPNSGGSVVVNPGDTVSGIAHAHGFNWWEFYRLNRKVIGANPNLIFPGMRLAVPHSGGN
ncbi:LysM peptidoglycan-binding domain-containing protein [Streptomyces inhibens]|nr:LysM peptidoglycan-binding domain-containing protein [Streptomyces inhibens]